MNNQVIIHVAFIVEFVLLYFCLFVAGSQKSGVFTKFLLNKEITSHDLYSVPVSSKIQCALRCFMDDRCSAVVTDCEMLAVNRHATCELKAKQTEENPYIIASKSKCHASRLSRSNQSATDSDINFITQTDSDVTSVTTQESTTSTPASTSIESTSVDGINFVIQTEGDVTSVTTQESPTSPSASTLIESTSVDDLHIVIQTEGDVTSVTTQKSTTSASASTSIESTSVDDLHIVIQTEGDVTSVTTQKSTTSASASTSIESTSVNDFNFVIQTEGDVTSVTTSVSTSNQEITTSDSASKSGYVVSILGDIKKICSGSSKEDLVIITTDGLFVYDDKDALTTGPCKGPLTFESIFPGFDGNRPTVDQIDCASSLGIIVYVYAMGKVWSWLSEDGQFQGLAGFPKSITSHFPEGNIRPEKPDWCTYRTDSTIDHIFYENSAFILRYFESPYVKTFTQSQSVKNFDDTERNLFKQLPANTITVTYTDISFTMWIVITSDLKYHEYSVGLDINMQQPPLKVTEKTHIKFF